MASVSGTMFSTSFLPRKPVVTRLKAIPNVAQALFGLDLVEVAGLLAWPLIK